MKCAFKEDSVLKWWLSEELLLAWLLWKFALEDAIETLSTMLDGLIILVDFWN